MVFWKIYFFFIVLLSVPLYLGGASGQSVEFAIDLAFFVVLMVGFCGFAWRKKIANSLFWKLFFPVCVIWNLGHAYYTFDGVFTVVVTAIYLPTLIALFLYAFRSEDLWNQ
jgi:hypothetical protein